MLNSYVTYDRRQIIKIYFKYMYESQSESSTI